MSRIGVKPIELSSDVTAVMEGNTITVKGPKGELTRNLHPEIKVNIGEEEITFERPSNNKLHRSLHGTTRSVVNNMVEGVKNGFEKSLELVGVGYRASKSGEKVVLNVGYSHPVEVEPEEGIELEVPSNTKVVVRGIDKERVGATASNIRSVRLPEPYKGKGIRYENEHVRQKVGKTGK
ncbi:50S ribosomal protein L6 [Salibacterium halotolerans]|uniref:Large ribosomal subunit protein uL6 n=1 Tax=Salibacterium halotolerans TaxID=1884432 RepID=A0A1I5WFH7_9BACI|nr:50S ribosomal protein L6 [Salibacterium halotolerans]SFQ18482.1 large subunit ribosomal protein L6 [Salibacterium halotolerans]